MAPPPPLAVRQTIVRLDDPPNVLREMPDGSHEWDSRITIPLGTYNTSRAYVVIGMRFPLPVPQGATILAAHLTMICARATNAAADGQTVVSLGAELSDDAAPFPYFDGEFGPSDHVLASRSMIGPTEGWSDPACSQGEVLTSPDISHLVTPLVTRSGWASGQHLAIHLNSSSGALTVEGVLMDVPELVVYYLDATSRAPTHHTSFLRLSHASTLRVESTTTGLPVASESTISLAPLAKTR